MENIKKMYYHTRHIPERQLNLDTPMGADVKRNGLCDVMREPYVSCMKDYNIDVVETRLVWWEWEKEPGVFDFSSLRADMKDIRDNGFGVGVFPWFMHPPKWEHEMVRAKCLEHGEESTIPSLWDPRLLEHYDRLYAALAAEMRDEIDFLYICIYGDFGEPQYPHDTKHYKFSPPHAHFGLWCGDDLARADFKRVLVGKYGTIEALNTAWGTAHKSFDEDLMELIDNINFRQDFQKWYSDSLMIFMDKACAVARKHFPDIRMGVPIGCKSDSLNFGQTKSEVSKICAKYNILSRCTTLSDFPDFAHSNVVTRRIATASQFYGAEYGVESPLIQDERRACIAVYQFITSSTVLVHDDPGNIYRAKDVFFKYRNLPGAMPFCCDTAVYYSVEEEKCHPKCGMLGFADVVTNDTEFYPYWIFDELAELRYFTDYDIVDHTLIADGFLDKCPRKLVLIRNTRIEREAADKIAAYQKMGGKVYYVKNAPPTILETGEAFLCGEAIDGYNCFGEFNRGVFATDHGDRISRFDEKNGEITFEMK